MITSDARGTGQVRWFFTAAIGIACLTAWGSSASQARGPLPEEMAAVRGFVEDHFDNPQRVEPAFAFHYGGKPSGELLQNWELKRASRKLDERRTEHTLTWTDPRSRLVVRAVAVEYGDFPAVEWTLHFQNSGTADTPILEQINALDVAFTRQAAGDFVLHRALGSSATRNDFAPVAEVLKQDTPSNRAAVGGRSSNTDALPFFNLEAVGEGGVMVGIGWSGQWAASLTREESTLLRARAGMELTHLKLHPGEEIRTPRILLLFWRGSDYMAGHNLLRRFVVAHVMPRKNGKAVTLPFACNGFPHAFDPSLTGAEFNDATQHNQIAFAQRYHQLGLAADYWWIDAGWYEGRWPNGVGNWFPRKDGFPQGLRPVSDAVKELGMGFLLWFEPERVHQGTWLDREHPEWVLKSPGNPNGLLNLGDEAALQWLTQHISGLIEREGISVYRQDFNIDPLAFWRAADAPDRQGMAEIRYIEGLYAFWDELLRRHPGLIIDNCASGGRRLDLETVSRSVSLWRTDYQYYEPNGYQSHTAGVSLYLPSTSTGCGLPDVYGFRSAMNNGLVVNWNLYAPDFPVETARRLVDEFRRVRHLFLEDYYPLTPHSVSDDTWMAHQFHREEPGDGMVLAFRRPQCPTATHRLKLRGLAPAARYEVNFEDRAVKQVFTGKDLADGVEVTADTAPGSLLITYRVLADSKP
jgi:alpha-galactosidase